LLNFISGNSALGISETNILDYKGALVPDFTARLFLFPTLHVFISAYGIYWGRNVRCLGEASYGQEAEEDNKSSVEDAGRGQARD
jgi:hypothetical protein